MKIKALFSFSLCCSEAPVSHTECCIVSAVKAPAHKETVLKTQSKTRKEEDKVTQLLSALRLALLDKDGKCIAVVYSWNKLLSLFTTGWQHCHKCARWPVFNPRTLKRELKMCNGHWFLHAITLLKIKYPKRGTM